MNEIKRVENFEYGEVSCPCGQKFTLWYNGGELDDHQCPCGLLYRTEYQRIDLVVYKNPESVTK